MNDSRFLLMAAPLQGLTETEWRGLHAAMYPGGQQPVAYFTPFARVEQGAVRPRDLREMAAAARAPEPTAAQVICRDAGEFALLADAAIAAGCTRIDLNAGCPFVPQLKRGRGAALIGRGDALRGIAEAMRQRPAVIFSLKMRLGVEDHDEWRAVAGIIAAMPLSHVAVHPRTARQLYKGELHHAEFDAVTDAVGHPVVFNGDILEPADIDRVCRLHPRIAGVMVGRGLLSRPSLFAEWAEGSEWDTDKRRRRLLDLADRLLGLYAGRLCGPSQTLMKIKPFWDYFGAGFDRRQVKAIAKSRSLDAYRAAVETLRLSPML